MLKKLKEDEFNSLVDRMYILACDYSKSSYPTYNDGIQTKERFIQDAKNSFQRENEETLLFCDEENVLGWIHYYYLKEDDYLATKSMQSSSKFDLMISEFEEYVARRYSNFSLYLSFPCKNTNAIEYVESHGYALLDYAHHMVLRMDDYKFINDDRNVSRLIVEDYEAFGILHDSVNDGMYWNSKRIKENIDRWDIFVYKLNNEIIAAIYNFKKETNEIYGVDFNEGIHNDVIYEALLISVANSCKSNGMKHLCYFCSDEELATTKKIGFRFINECKGYVKRKQ